MKQFKILIDTKGSDNGAEMMIRGADLALRKYPELSVLLVGDTDVMKRECERLSMPMDRVERLEAPETITNYDSPAEALFVKRDSSLVKALEALSTRDDLVGLINAGSTGALIAGSMRYLSGKDRVRPALAAVLPSENGGFTCLVDKIGRASCRERV